MERENIELRNLKLKKEHIEKLLNAKTGFASITKEDADALSIVAELMSRYGIEYARENEREIAIISYHSRNPNAVMMRDNYTISALKEALFCIEEHIARTK